MHFISADDLPVGKHLYSRNTQHKLKVMFQENVIGPYVLQKNIYFYFIFTKLYFIYLNFYVCIFILSSLYRIRNIFFKYFKAFGPITMVLRAFLRFEASFIKSDLVFFSFLQIFF